MNRDATGAQSIPAKRSLFKTFLLSLPMMLLTFVMISRGNIPTERGRLFALAATFVFFNILFFLMLRTGKTDRFRSILFLTLSVCFVISFISNLIAVRGSMAVTEANRIEGEVPFCHIPIPMNLIPAALTQTIIFPGTIVGGYASIASMFVLWLGVSLGLGREGPSPKAILICVDEGNTNALHLTSIRFPLPSREREPNLKILPGLVFA